MAAHLNWLNMRDVAWLLGCSGLVFLMQPGFMCLESGMTRSKNSINVAAKNLSDFGISALLYWLFGFGVMFGPSWWGWMGHDYFALSVESQPQLAAFLIFQLMFCGTSTTIISGAVAERMRFSSYLIVCFLCSGLIYPLFGHWAWKGMEIVGASPAGQGVGWLRSLGFYDFAGSTVVHSVGGWIALATLLVVGPRWGRYDEATRQHKISGSNLPFSMLGAMMLWLGWLGFNGGSTLALNEHVPAVLVHTVIGGVAGMLGGGALGWYYRHRPDVECLINSSLAGMVAVTACCNVITTPIALVVGFTGAAVALVVEWWLDRRQIDDAVGAVPIHAGAGAWGTLCVGLFGDLSQMPGGLERPQQIAVQLLGIGVCALWSFGLSYGLLRWVDRLHPLRVSLAEEQMGLNVAEHQVKTEVYDLFEVMDHHARQGDLHLRVPVDPFTEVGYIAERYNQVMDALQEKSQALESLNASLEAQVQQRTAELETANQELQRLNRLKDDLLANTSHELRTPLNGIIGLAEAMLDDDRGGLSDRERSNLDTIAASGHRLANLVNDLLDFAKLQHQTIDLALRPCTLAVVVEQVLQLHYDQAERKGLALVNAIDLALPPVLADFNRLQQILHNLVSNALKFTQSGEVIVHARRWQPDAELLHQLHQLHQPPSVDPANSLDPQLGDQQLGQQLDQLTGVVMPSSAIGQGALFDRPGLDSAESEQLEREPPSESPPATAAQKWLAISVSDTGIGIPTEAIERIFESFEQADRSTAREYGGTGLGLAIVRQLVELHGGKIWVESRPEVGSIFTLTLPVALEAPALTYEMPSFRRSPMMLRKSAPTNPKPAPEDPIAPEPITLAPATVEGDRLLEALSQRDTEQLLAKASAARTQPNQRFKILMVDDEPVNLQVLENFLSQEEYEIVTADNGPAALAVLEQGFQPDVVLVDVMMPKMTGYELTQQLRSRYPAHKLPILMLTAKNQVEDLVQGLDSGANDYLTKPVSKKELLARLKTHLQLSHINIAYGRFVPHEFLRLLNKQSILEVELGDQVERQMSVLFSDIRSFTTITENLLPAESFRFINRYLAHMEPAIQQNGGFIDKFIGDAVMALFPESADDAVASAIEMRRNLEVFNRERQQAGEVPIEIGIGINTGQMRLGTVGGKNRMDGTAISDAVNLAARLETLTKRYQSSILISHHTIAQMEDPTRYHLRFIDRLQVTGKSRPVAVFEAIDGDPSPIRDQKLSTMAHFEEGTWLYHRQEFKSAAVCFEECLRQFPGDRVAQIYLERSVHAALPTTD